MTSPKRRIERRVPGFRVHVVAPGPRLRSLWTYVTTGCWQAVNDQGHGIEFLLATREFTMRGVEMLTKTAFYHAGPPDQRLGLGHTTSLGEPWLPGSLCDHALISLPFPWGSEVEFCSWNGGHARLLWVLPITRAERDFKRAHGVDALEQRFEEVSLDYSDPARSSVV